MDQLPGNKLQPVSPAKPALQIMVTGGAGLVGNEVIQQLLEQGYKVTATFNRAPLKITHVNLTNIKCNILDVDVVAEVMHNMQIVFHCAALVSFNDADADDIIAVNVNGTANIVNAAIDARVQKLIYVSSVSAIAKHKNQELLNENFGEESDVDSSLYGKSKLWAEMEVWRGIGEGLDAIIVNPSIILGGSDWTKGSTKIFKSAWEEFPWYAEGVTGFVDVRDVAKAMIRLWQQNTCNERFILSAENLSYKDVFFRIATCFGKKQPHKKVNAFLAGIIWRWEAIKKLFTQEPPLLTKQTALHALQKNYFDNTKVKNTLSGFAFRPISQTIADTCEVLKGVYHL